MKDWDGKGGHIENRQSKIDNRKCLSRFTRSNIATFGLMLALEKLTPMTSFMISLKMTWTSYAKQ
jgi:hypothetical protein